MSKYSIDKLRRSLTVKVMERIQILLPEATIQPDRNGLSIQYMEMEGRIGMDAMVQACHKEDRDLWGTIAGSFCNLVVARVMSSMVPPLDSSANLDAIWVSLTPESEIEDRMIAEATPHPKLEVCGRTWLPGLRMECDYDGPEGQRRILRRDLEGLGLSEEALFSRAVQNMTVATSQVEIMGMGEGEVEKRILHLESDSAAPAMLVSSAAHERLFEALATTDGSDTGHLIAVAPRTDLLLCCRARDREAASMMVAHAWEVFDSDHSSAIPLSPRTFSIAAPGDVKFEDMGQTAANLVDWSPQTVGDMCFQLPPSWEAQESGDGRWKLLPSGDANGLRVAIQVLTGETSAPKRIYELAQGATEDNAAKPIAFGFFNALPWARVDTGQRDGLNTTQLFVSGPTQILSITTAFAPGTAMPEILNMQKVVASVCAA